MAHLYTIDHSRKAGYLRNFDPLNHYYGLWPNNDASRHIIVPQENLLHFDDFLLPCNVPTIIASKQTYFYNELLFISARSSPSWLKQKKLDMKHSIPLMNNTLLDNQKSPLTNLTMFLHHELFVISLTNLIHTNRILRIFHSPHSHIFSNATITLSRYYNLWILTHNVQHNHPKQFKSPSNV